MSLEFRIKQCDDYEDNTVGGGLWNYGSSNLGFFGTRIWNNQARTCRISNLANILGSSRILCGLCLKTYCVDESRTKRTSVFLYTCKEHRHMPIENKRNGSTCFRHGEDLK